MLRFSRKPSESVLIRFSATIPALQPAVWSGTKRIPKGYELKLDRYVFNDSLLDGINAIPASMLFGEQIPDMSYTVRRGDSLSVIAERYDTSVSELVAINQLRDRNRIRVGQTLLLPQPDGSVPTLLVSNQGPQPIPATGRYEVRRGDTVSFIAKRFSVPIETVLSLNGLNDSGTIYPGQVLQLRKSSEDTLVASAENVSGDFQVSAEQPVLIINEDEELELGDTSSLFVKQSSGR